MNVHFRYGTLQKLVSTFTEFTLYYSISHIQSMATFSLKKFSSKIYAYELYNEFFKKHNVSAFFEISESVPRKAALDIIADTWKGVDTATRLEMERELSYVLSFSTEHAAKLYKELLTKELGAAFEPEIECETPQDLVFYCYLRHENMLPRVLFLHDFYMSKSYTMYEAEDKGIVFDEKKDDLLKDFERIANKDDNATECIFAYETVGNTLFLSATFEGRYEIEEAIDKEKGELDRTKTKRKVERVFVAYVKDENRVLIRGSVGKTALTHFLDSFLRIACDVQYEGKKEVFDLAPFTNLGLEFHTLNKGTPLLRWKIKGVSLLYAGGKKSLRLSLPSPAHSVGMTPLTESLDELGMTAQYSNFSIQSVSCVFTFADKEREGKTKNVSVSLSSRKSGLCPLFTEHNYARKLLLLADIDKGFQMEE